MNKPLLMTRVRNRVNRLLKSRAGQSTTEYILILAIVVMIATKLKTALSSTVLNTGMSGLDNQMQSMFNGQ